MTGVDVLVVALVTSAVINVVLAIMAVSKPWWQPKDAREEEGDLDIDAEARVFRTQLRRVKPEDFDFDEREKV